MPILNVNKISPVGLGQYWATKALQTDPSNAYGAAQITSGYYVRTGDDAPSLGVKFFNGAAPWGSYKNDLIGQYNVAYDTNIVKFYDSGNVKIPYFGTNYSQRPSYFNGPKTIFKEHFAGDALYPFNLSVRL